MNLFEQGFKKAKNLTVEELQRPKTIQKDNKILPLVIMHNLNNLQVIGKIRESVRLLNSYSSLKDIL